mgnify:CR=1 FL=1
MSLRLLSKARDLLGRGWDRQGPALGIGGRRVEARNAEAQAWSLFGALAAAGRPMSADWDGAVRKLMEVTGEPSPLDLLNWSESAARTQDEVLGALEAACRAYLG